MKSILPLLLLVSCASTIDRKTLNEKESQYFDTVLSKETSFIIENTKTKEVMSRGYDFLNRFSGMKIQSNSDFHVETYSPYSTENGTIGYAIRRVLNGDKSKFSVECSNRATNFKYTSSVCRMNEKILVHYMMTGELNEKFVNTALPKKQTK